MSTLTLASLIEQRLYSLGRRQAAAAFERLQPFFRSLNFQVEEKDRTEARDRFAQIVNGTASRDEHTPMATLVRKHRREEEAVLLISLDELAGAVETLLRDFGAQVGQSRPLRGLLDGLTPVLDPVRPEFGTVNLDTSHRHHALRWSESDADAEQEPVGTSARAS